LPLSLFVLAASEHVGVPSSFYHTIPVTEEGLFKIELFDRFKLANQTTTAGLMDEYHYLDLRQGPDSFEEYLNKNTIEKYRLNDLSLEDGHIYVAHPKSCSHSLRASLIKEEGLLEEDLQRFLSLLSEDERSQCQEFLNGKEAQPLRFIGPSAFFTQFINRLQALVEHLYQDTDAFKLTLSRIKSWSGLSGLLLQLHLADAAEEIVRCATVKITNGGNLLSLPRWKDDSLAVVFAANEGFAPALAVCMNSLLDHINPTKQYDIVVLHRDITLDSQNKLQLLAKRYPNVSLRFFNPEALLSGFTLQKNPTDHISIETYYRFLIADILIDYDRVAYLDCDTVILDDVAKLFEINVDDHLLSACIDAEIPAQRSGVDPTMAPYLKNVLGLEEDDPYLQAGVLLLNLQAMRAFRTVDQWLALASERKYRYNDQDILNKECKGRFALLPMEWNVVVNCNNQRLPIIEQGPHEVYAAYMQARQHPKIIHYAGFEKPWDAPSSDWAYLFWHYAPTSEFYERLLAMRQNDGGGEQKQNLMSRLLPRGSKRRTWARRWYYTIRRT
jgi:lipopolysaccharide biosynthesis glycosyltransferase